MLYARDGLAIVSGLNPDAPLGTKVAFLTGAAGWVIWEVYGGREGQEAAVRGRGQGAGDKEGVRDERAGMQEVGWVTGRRGQDRH